MPWRLVASCSHFARAVHGIRPPGGVYTHVAGCDLVRHSDGTWKVIEDNVRIPSGISYVLENRAAMARLVPELFASYRVRPVDHYPQLLLRALRSVAPVGRERGDGRRVDAGPGQPRLLRARLPRAPDGRRAGRGLRPRRPRRRALHAHHPRPRARPRRLPAPRRRLRRPARVPPRLAARRARAACAPTAPGSVAIANAFGTGVADDKAIYCFVPDMIRFYLGEEPILENVQHLPALRPRSARARARPPRPAGGQADRRVGRPRRDDRPARRRAARSRGCASVISAHPDRWIAQDVVRLSTVPTVGERRRARAPPRRPAPVRGLRRAHRHRPRRPHARGARGGLADRQLLPRRRLEGHVGARGRRRRRPRRPADRRHPAARAARPALRRLDRPATAATTATASRARSAGAR